MCSRLRSWVLALSLELQQNAGAKDNMRTLRTLSAIKERSVVTSIPPYDSISNLKVLYY